MILNIYDTRTLQLGVAAVTIGRVVGMLAQTESDLLLLCYLELDRGEFRSLVGAVAVGLVLGLPALRVYVC